MSNENDSVLDETPNDSANVRQVKALYRALKLKDRKRIGEILADAPVWDVSPGFPEGAIYTGMARIFDGFYRKLLAHVHSFGAFPDCFVDGGDTVVALGHYRVTRDEGSTPIWIRFSHTWHVNEEGRVKGVWQVADSARFFAHLPGEQTGFSTTA